MRVTSQVSKEVPGAIDGATSAASSPESSETVSNGGDGVDTPGGPLLRFDAAGAAAEAERRRRAADGRPSEHEELPRAVACQIDHRAGVSRPVSPQTTQKDVDDLADAAARGDVGRCKSLLAQGVDLEGKDSQNGMTPLMRAAEAGQMPVVRLLLDSCAQLKRQDSQFRTAVFLAARNGHLDVVKALHTAERSAAELPAEFGRTPLMEAAARGDAKMVEVLAAGAKPRILDFQDMPGQTALFEAAQNGHADSVAALLKQGASLLRNASGTTVLMAAARNGDPRTMQLLLAAAAKLPPADRDRLLNAQDSHGRTALTIATAGGHEDAALALIGNRDVKVDLPDPRGRTALLDAARVGSANVIAGLLQRGVNVNAADADKRTALMEAAANGNSGAVHALLQARPGPQLDRQDKDGNTALMDAIGRVDVSAVKQLLAAGASIAMKTTAGTSTLDLARDRARTTFDPQLVKNSAQVLQLVEQALASGHP